MKTTLLTKQISGNRQSLFLDYYPPIPHPETGKPTRREILNLYLYNDYEYNPQTKINDSGNTVVNYLPVLNKKGDHKKTILTPTEKEHNKKTRELAENIRAKRQLEIQSGNYGFLNKDKKQTDFLAFLKEEAEKRKAQNNGDKNNWMSLYRHLDNFTNGICTEKHLTEKFCKDFKEYLQNTKPLIRTRKQLANNSAVHYFVIFKSAIKKAYEKKLLEQNPARDISSIQKIETQREFLTYEELQQLAKTDCVYPILKNAALFSALTGLRYSDIEKLVWKEVIQDNDVYSIRYTQKKTGNPETLPISRQAFQLLGLRGEASEKVFKNLLYSSWQNMLVQDWVRRAGVTKHITFHNFRHTYATLQLTLGTDIYTVSKMLGHRDLKTTQIYAKIIDAKKREASNKIVLEF